MGQNGTAMRGGRSTGDFLEDHEWLRFVLLIAFMSGLAAFAAWRVVVVLSADSSHEAWLVVALGGGLLVCLGAWPTVLGVSSRHPPWGPARKLSRSVRLWTVVIMSLVAIVALMPSRSTPVRFWQPGWLQLLGSGFFLGFAGLLVQRRVRQKAWRGFDSDDRPI